MTTQRLLQVSVNAKDAASALKKVIPSMESGFNINAIHGDISVTGDDAKAVMDFLAQRLQAKTSVDYLRREATLGKREDFDPFLKLVPDVPAQAGDEV